MEKVRCIISYTKGNCCLRYFHVELSCDNIISNKRRFVCLLLNSLYVITWLLLGSMMVDKLRTLCIMFTVPTANLYVSNRIVSKR